MSETEKGPRFRGDSFFVCIALYQRTPQTLTVMVRCRDGVARNVQGRVCEGGSSGVEQDSLQPEFMGVRADMPDFVLLLSSGILLPVFVLVSLIAP